VPSLSGLKLSASSALVVRLPDGRLMGALNPEQVRPLASLTKIMTAVVAMEVGPKLDELVTVTKADNTDSLLPYMNAGDKISYLFVDDGQTLKLRDVLTAALVGSANNAAATLARVSGLGQEGFVTRMNERAQVLGMYATHFSESTGLSPANTSTAYDYAILARYAWANKTLRQVSSLPKASVVTQSGKRHTIRNTNTLLSRPPQGITPIASKTGFITEAGYNLAMEWRGRGGSQYLLVLLNAPTLSARSADAVKIMRWLEPKT
jgi:D-alanyl-D-alanine carboxypeptidase